MSNYESNVFVGRTTVAAHWAIGYNDIRDRLYPNSFRPEYENWNQTAQMDYEIGRLQAILIESYGKKIPFLPIDSITGRGIVPYTFNVIMAEIGLPINEVVSIVCPNYRSRQPFEEEEEEEEESRS